MALGSGQAPSHGATTEPRLTRRLSTAARSPRDRERRVRFPTAGGDTTKARLHVWTEYVLITYSPDGVIRVGCVQTEARGLTEFVTLQPLVPAPYFSSIT